MPISSYDDIQDTGLVAGQIYSNELSTSVRTGINSSGEVLTAGYGCVKGAGDGEVTAISGAADLFYGIVGLPNSLEKRVGYSLDANNNYGFPGNYETAYINQGVVAVWVDGTVAEGDDVYLNHTASTSVVGAFRADANSSNAVQITGARFSKGATGTPAALAIAVVSINRA